MTHFQFAVGVLVFVALMGWVGNKAFKDIPGWEIYQAACATISIASWAMLMAILIAREVA